jgi:predicted RecB family nuclease
LKRFGDGEVPQRNLPLTDLLKQQYLLATDVYFARDGISVLFDALLRNDDSSSSPRQKYIPMMFHHQEKISKNQKLLLSFWGLMLENGLENKSPVGKILHGKAFKCTKVNFNPLFGTVNNILREINNSRITETAPPLCLKPHCSICEYRTYCEEKAIEKDDLSLLRGISEKEINRLHKKGIFTVNQLSHTFKPRRIPKRAKNPATPHHFALQALALREKKIHVYGTPNISLAETNIYFDMEGLPDKNFCYLIGALVVQNGKSTCHTFWADNEKEQKRIFVQFQELVGQYPGSRLFHFGNYDVLVLKQIGKVLDRRFQRTLQHHLERCVNVLSIIYPHIYFPTFSNGLKDIGGFLGCKWTQSNASGIQSIVWRNAWENTHDSSVKKILIQYNKEDCHALRKVTEFVCAICSDAKSGQSHIDSQNVELVDEMALNPDYKWGQKNFALENFDILTKCAYFDYQRSKVFFRTNANIKRISSKNKRRNKAEYRSNKEVLVKANKCRYCKRANVIREEKRFHSKTQLDLRISSGGIKKWVTRFRTPFHKCEDCNINFLPPKYKKQKRFGHTLVAWAMYQHITNRVTFENLERTIKDYFGLRIRANEFWKMKQMAAEYYKGAYNRILKQIVTGTVVHADETTVRLQKTSGYVWILTNMEDVIYMYRPTRKTDFLHKVLKDFKGVLISDFYSGYDSLPCAQQKCLIHLTWDLNNALLKEPFNNGLQELGRCFGVLMRSIIGTIDKFGLKSRFMKKHKREVKRFYDSIVVKPLDSEKGENLRKRMIKYKSKLFCFLDYDGVPWNNNNAEHAVKPFAKYRRIVNGQINEGGLSSYLTLLSLYETCNYKGLDFFEFLLSKKRNINSFFEST